MWEWSPTLCRWLFPRCSFHSLCTRSRGTFTAGKNRCRIRLSQWQWLTFNIRRWVLWQVLSSQSTTTQHFVRTCLQRKRKSDKVGPHTCSFLLPSPMQGPYGFVSALHSVGTGLPLPFSWWQELGWVTKTVITFSIITNKITWLSRGFTLTGAVPANPSCGCNAQ